MTTETAIKLLEKIRDMDMPYYTWKAIKKLIYTFVKD